MKLAFIFVGGHKEEWLTEFASEYEAKLKPFCPVEIVRLKPTKLARGSSDQKRDDECASIMKSIKKDDVVVEFDPAELASFEF